MVLAVAVTVVVAAAAMALGLAAQGGLVGPEAEAAPAAVLA